MREYRELLVEPPAVHTNAPDPDATPEESIVRVLFAVSKVVVTFVPPTMVKFPDECVLLPTVIPIPEAFIALYTAPDVTTSVEFCVTEVVVGGITGGV